MKIIIQLILIAIAAKLLWNIIKKYLPKVEDKTEIGGNSKREESLDFDEGDIQDAKFTEVEDSEEDRKNSKKDTD